MVSYGLVDDGVLLDNALCALGVVAAMWAAFIISQAHTNIRRSRARKRASELRWERSALDLVQSHIKCDQAVYGSEDNLYSAYYKGLCRRIKEDRCNAELTHELLNMNQYKIDWLIQEYRHIQTINGVVEAWRKGSMPTLPLSEGEYDAD